MVVSHLELKFFEYGCNRRQGRGSVRTHSYVETDSEFIGFVDRRIEYYFAQQPDQV